MTYAPREPTAWNCFPFWRAISEYEGGKSLSRTTLQDVAKTAGVSLATVDRVLNRRPGVHADTAERVQRAADNRLVAV